MEVQVDDFGAGIEEIRAAPTDDGTVELIVQRPAEGEREVLSRAYFDTDGGLIGDGWLSRDGNPARQVTVMNARVAALLAPRQRWPLAGDQLFVDLDLSKANLAAGDRLAVGAAVLVITAEPHLGCKKFAQRFGVDALRLVNSTVGRDLRLRGLNAQVARAGVVRPGDAVRPLRRRAGQARGADRTGAPGG